MVNSLMGMIPSRRFDSVIEMIHYEYNNFKTKPESGISLRT